MIAARLDPLIQMGRHVLKTLAIDARFVCYGSVTLWIQFVCAGWLDTPDLFQSLRLQDFAIGAGILQALCGAVGLVILSGAHKQPAARILNSLKALLVLGPLGVALLMVPTVPAAVAGGAFGIGCISSYALWGWLLSKRTDISILTNVLVGQAFGAFFTFIASRVPYELALAGILVFLIAACVVLMRSLPSTPLEEGGREEATHDRWARDEVVGLLQHEFLPVILVFASTVVVAITSGTGAIPTAGWSHYGLNTLLIPLGCTIMVCVFIVLYACGKIGVYCCFVIFPLLSGCAVMLSLAPFELSPALINDITFALSYLANLFGFSFLCIIMRRHPALFPRTPLLLRGIMAICLVVSYAMTQAGQGELIVGIAQGALMILMLLGVGADKLGPKATARESASRQQDAARLYNLSKRETEIAGWLLKGYRAPYIAEQLFISENTVRTHIRSIYRKASVSSRDEFLALFDSAASPDTDHPWGTPPQSPPGV